MRKRQTYFEQIPVEVVKNIAQEEVAEKDHDGVDDVIVEHPTKKTEPYSIGSDLI